MHYKIKFLKNVTEEELPALPKKIESRIKKAIQERLTVDPVNLGEPLHHSFKGFKRLRVGDYRIMYSVDTEKHEVTIITLGHRDNFYEKALKIIKKTLPITHFLPSIEVIFIQAFSDLFIITFVIEKLKKMLYTIYSSRFW